MNRDAYLEKAKAQLEEGNAELDTLEAKARGAKAESGRFAVETSRERQRDLAAPRRRILLVDRHTLMRRAAAAWINRCPGLEVCGMARGMTQTFRAVRRLHPDIVVTEIMRPHDLGFIQELHHRHPRLVILVFTIQDEGEYGARGREAGACGYLMKEAGGSELIRTICAVLRRQTAAKRRAG